MAKTEEEIKSLLKKVKEESEKAGLKLNIQKMKIMEKSLESPLDSKEIQPVHSEGDQPWDFFGGNDAEAETLVLWPPDVKIDSLEKTLTLGGIWGRRRRERQRMR